MQQKEFRKKYLILQRETTILFKNRILGYWLVALGR